MTSIFHQKAKTGAREEVTCRWLFKFVPYKKTNTEMQVVKLELRQQ